MSQLDHADTYLVLEQPVYSTWLGIPYGSPIGVHRHYADLTEETLTLAEVEEEKVAALEAAEAHDAEVAAEAHDAEVAAEAHDAEVANLAENRKFERVMSALDSQFPGFRKQVNDLAKIKRISRAASLKEIRLQQEVVADANETLEDLRELGYRGRI